MRRWVICFLCLGLAISASCGCYGHLEEEDTVAITGFGVDVQDGQKMFSAQVACPTGKPEEGQAETETLVLTNTAPGYAQAGRLSLLGFPRNPIWSLSTAILVGEGVAREDLALMMDFVTRNRFIRPNILMFLSRGATPDEVMKVATPPEDYSMVGLVKMIKNQEEQNGIYMPVTLRDFRNKYITSGVEPILPQVEILEVDGEKMLHLNGIAVFKGHHMVGELNERESRGLRFLAHKPIRGGLVPVNVSWLAEANSDPLQNIVTMEITSSQARHTPQASPAGICVLVEIESDGNIYEQNGTTDLQAGDNLAMLELLTAQAIEADVSACIKRAQSLQSDIFGWGTLISRKYPDHWQNLEQDWPQYFGSVEVQIEVKYSVRRSYLMEAPLPFES